MQANRYMYALCIIIINLIIADQEQDTMQARALVQENQAASPSCLFFHPNLGNLVVAENVGSP